MSLSEPEDHLAKHRAIEQDHWEHQRRVNKRTLALGVFAVFANSVTAILSIWAIQAALESAKQTGREAEAAYNDQRPWLAVDLKLDDLEHNPTAPIRNVFSRRGAM